MFTAEQLHASSPAANECRPTWKSKWINSKWDRSVRHTGLQPQILHYIWCEQRAQRNKVAWRHQATTSVLFASVCIRQLWLKAFKTRSHSSYPERVGDSETAREKSHCFVPRSTSSSSCTYRRNRPLTAFGHRLVNSGSYYCLDLLLLTVIWFEINTLLG